MPLGQHLLPQALSSLDDSLGSQVVLKEYQLSPSRHQVAF